GGYTGPLRLYAGDRYQSVYLARQTYSLDRLAAAGPGLAGVSAQYMLSADRVAALSVRSALYRTARSRGYQPGPDAPGRQARPLLSGLQRCRCGLLYPLYPSHRTGPQAGTRPADDPGHSVLSADVAGRLYGSDRSPQLLGYPPSPPLCVECR